MLGVALDATQNKFTRIMFGFLGVNTLLVIGLITYIPALVYTENTKTPKHLYNFLMDKTLNLNAKLKIYSFVEKLTESFIGLNCLSFFHFTSTKFYEYIFVVSSTFFMISKMFKVI